MSNSTGNTFLAVCRSSNWSWIRILYARKGSKPEKNEDGFDDVKMNSK
jgi:hypothetical protein